LRVLLPSLYRTFEQRPMKVVAPNVLVALKDALSTINWYKQDLRSFLAHAVADASLFARVNWSDQKRNIVSLVVDYMARRQEDYLPALLKLIGDVTSVTDFSHLERLEGGAEKARQAREAVAALARLAGPYTGQINQASAVQERSAKAAEARLRAQGVRDKLDELRRLFMKVISPAEPQQRGYHLEMLLRELFHLFDLDPRASFRVVGEQIDGAFTFDNTDYLLEAKWQQALVGIQDLDAFDGKVRRRLENTLGLFLSVNGFSPDAITAHTRTRPMIILADGRDLTTVLEGQIGLIDLLLRKRRHAAQTGNIYFSASDILQGM
jgi:Restriction endonuclease